MSQFPYLHFPNFQYLTGLSKDIGLMVDQAMGLCDISLAGALTAGRLRPGSLNVQYDVDADEFSWCWTPFTGGKLDELLARGVERYGDASGKVALIVVMKRGPFRELTSVPLAAVTKKAPDQSRLFQVYIHGFVHDETGQTILEGNTYIGVTKRGWRTRWAEHLAAAGRGSRYRFHEAIRHWRGKATTISHDVIASGLNEAEAMALEEKMVGYESLYPRGLNMIPGGYAGLAYLNKIGAVGKNERITPDEKSAIVDRFFERTSRKGLPNPLAAANWLDSSYAEKVICGPEDRLKPDQVRNARHLSSLGKEPGEIAAEIGARNIGQVERLIAGDTYSRVA